MGRGEGHPQRKAKAGSQAGRQAEHGGGSANTITRTNTHHDISQTLFPPLSLLLIISLAHRLSGLLLARTHHHLLSPFPLRCCCCCCAEDARWKLDEGNKHCRGAHRRQGKGWTRTKENQRGMTRTTMTTAAGISGENRAITRTQQEGVWRRRVRREARVVAGSTADG